MLRKKEDTHKQTKRRGGREGGREADRQAGSKEKKQGRKLLTHGLSDGSRSVRTFLTAENFRAILVRTTIWIALWTKQNILSAVRYNHLVPPFITNSLPNYAPTHPPTYLPTIGLPFSLPSYQSLYLPGRQAGLPTCLLPTKLSYTRPLISHLSLVSRIRARYHDSRARYHERKHLYALLCLL